MHRELQRRLSAKDAGLHHFAKRVAQNRMDDDEPGTNMLPNGPITITIVRTIPLPPPTITASTTTRSTTLPYGYNHGASYPPSMETILPSNPSSSPQIASSSTSASVSAPPAETSSASGISDNNTAPDPASGASTQRNKLPPGAMIGIVIAGIFLVVGIAIFVIRRRYVQRRLKLRKGWTRSKGSRLSGSHEPKGSVSSLEQTTAMLANSPSNRPTGTPRAPRPLSLEASQTPFVLPAPLASYGNETYASASQTTLMSGGFNPKRVSKNHSSPVYGPPSAFSGSTATVISTFITTLPDELAITTGESLRILAEYDDGWALCLNSRGEQGMVPRECLDGRFDIAVEEMTISRGAGGKLKRISSLQATVGNLRRF